MDSVILKLVLFIVVSSWFLFISWKSLRNVHSHGFYRFFAWETILGLILININVWFFNPLSVLQIISWVFLIVSVVLLALSLYLIRAVGRPNSQHRGDTLLQFENTSALVTSGIYHYIRHPMYGSLLFLAWGTFFKEISWYSILLVVVATLCLVATAKADEAECIQYFGVSYQKYMVRTKMFVPFLY
jgi:protein-S-isoprenylcysteine O-methyltransferase Ste14